MRETRITIDENAKRLARMTRVLSFIANGAFVAGLVIFAIPVLLAFFGQFVTIGNKTGWAMIVGLMPFFIAVYIAPITVCLFILAGVLRFVAGRFE